MSGLDETVRRVRARAAAMTGCGTQQALVYAIEDEVDSALGTRSVPRAEVTALLATMCEVEDIDPPRIARTRSRMCVAASDLSTRTIRVRDGASPLSALVHELAHIVSASENHGEEFRDELVRLTRAHVSVGHAAHLHSLFVALALPVAVWRG